MSRLLALCVAAWTDDWARSSVFFVLIGLISGWLACPDDQDTRSLIPFSYRSSGHNSA